MPLLDPTLGEEGGLEEGAGGSAGAGTGEEGGAAGEAQGKLEAFAAERGLSVEDAIALLTKATDEDAQLEEQARAQQAEQDFEQRYSERFRKEAGGYVAGKLKDRTYAEAALSHIRAHHPDLVGKPGTAEEEDPDPVAALARRNHAETERLKEELVQLRKERQADLEQRTAFEVKQQALRQIERLFATNVDAQRFEEQIVEDLRDAYDANPGRFKNPLEIKQLFTSRYQRYAKLSPGQQPKTTPPRGTAGRPGPAPARTKLPDLSAEALAKDALAFFGEHRGSGE